MNICVLGAGIIGVSSALRLKQNFPGISVTIIAELFTPNNTSDGAVGNIIPFPEGTNETLLLRWFKETYDRCEKLIYQHPDASNMGVSHIIGTYLYKSKKEFPKWCHWMHGFCEVSEEEKMQYPVPVSCGFSIKTIFCESSKYIPKMMQEFIKLGGTCQKKKIHDFKELAGVFDIVVNCTGLNSRILCKDDSMFPVRGQVLRVKAPWIKNYIGYDMDLNDRIMIVSPNQENCVLGVTFQKDDYNREPTEEDRKWIIEQATSFYPALKNAPVLYDWVGLRPGRDGVRLEKEILSFDILDKEEKLTVIHNYGHYASGVSLHWGCAGDVVKLVDEVLNPKNMKSKL